MGPRLPARQPQPMGWRRRLRERAKRRRASPLPPAGQDEAAAAMQQLRGVAATSPAGTICGERRSPEGVMGIARELDFTGGEGLAKLSQVARPLLQAAEVAEMTGLSNMVSAGIEYAHMTGSYEPAALEARLNTLRSIARLTRQTMKGEESILNYSVPIGIAAGMDLDKVAMETGFLQQQGFNTSTAGTGLAALILPDRPIEVHDHSGMLYSTRSIHTGAKWTIRENDRGLYLARHTDFPAQMLGHVAHEDDPAAAIAAAS